MPRDHSKRFTFETVNGNPGWRDQIERTISKAEENDVDTAALLALLEPPPTPPPTFENPNPEPPHRKWGAADIKTVVDALIACCPDVACSALGGTNDDDPILDEEFKQDTVLEEADKLLGKKLKWRQRIYDKIDEAINFECICCWFIAADVNITFTGNTVENPQTISLITKADCEAVAQELADLLSNALIAWLAENMDVIENLEGFNIEAVPDSVSVSVSNESDCPTAFQPPVIES